MTEQVGNDPERKLSDGLETDKVRQPFKEVTEADLDPSEIIVVKNTRHEKIVRYARPLIKHLNPRKTSEAKDDQAE